MHTVCFSKLHLPLCFPLLHWWKFDFSLPLATVFTCFAFDPASQWSDLDPVWAMALLDLFFVEKHTLLQQNRWYHVVLAPATTICWMSKCNRESVSTVSLTAKCWVFIWILSCNLLLSCLQRETELPTMVSFSFCVLVEIDMRLLAAASLALVCHLKCLTTSFDISFLTLTIRFSFFFCLGWQWWCQLDHATCASEMPPNASITVACNLHHVLQSHFVTLQFVATFGFKTMVQLFNNQTQNAICVPKTWGLGFADVLAEWSEAHIGPHFVIRIDVMPSKWMQKTGCDLVVWHHHGWSIQPVTSSCFNRPHHPCNCSWANSGRSTTTQLAALQCAQFLFNHPTFVRNYPRNK